MNYDDKVKKYLEAGDERDRPAEFAEAAKQCIGVVLEVGCCFGHFSKYLPKEQEYVGIDISPIAIKRAVELYGNKRGKANKRTFYVGEFPMSSSKNLAGDWLQVETVVALQVMEHFPCLDCFIRGCIGFHAKKLVFSVPKGELSYATVNNDGHLLGWVGMHELRDDLRPWGKTTFWDGDKEHICGTVDFTPEEDLRQFTGRSQTHQVERKWLLDRLPERGLFVEVGTFHGVTAAYLAEKRPNLRVQCVDPFVVAAGTRAGSAVNWYLNARENMNLAVCTFRVWARTQEAKSVDAVFLDGAHSQEAIYDDLRVAEGVLRVNGFLAVHDYLNGGVPGVKQGTDAFCSERKWKIVHTVDSSIELKRG